MIEIRAPNEKTIIVRVSCFVWVGPGSKAHISFSHTQFRSLFCPWCEVFVGEIGAPSRAKFIYYVWLSFSVIVTLLFTYIVLQH